MSSKSNFYQMKECVQRFLAIINQAQNMVRKLFKAQSQFLSKVGKEQAKYP